MSSEKTVAACSSAESPLNYKVAYLRLFNQVSDTITLLQQAQQAAEEQAVADLEND